MTKDQTLCLQRLNKALMLARVSRALSLEAGTSVLANETLIKIAIEKQQTDAQD